MAKDEDIVKWIKKYNKKMGNFWEDWDLEWYPFIHIFEDGSFFTYGVCGEYLECGPVSIDFKKAFPTMEAYAKRLGLKGVSTITPHNPKAYARLTKSTLKEKKFLGGQWQYYFVREVN